MEELVRKAQKGDKEAFYKIISEAKVKLYKTAFAYLKDEHAALEAVAETTCRAYLSIGKLRDCRYFSTWVTKILINYCLDELKYISKHAVLDDYCFEPVHILNEDTGADDRLDLNFALNLIKPKYRDVIIMKFFEDISVEDIAQSLNKPAGTIKTWINRGLKQLRQKLKESENHV
ncbi:MAG: sigma-70 family polymerase sigma factor [Eubacterium sp.]|jgi:RNA polymerase sigma-70 factor (ECF subfamily)|nr:sigma-70 family polymerase sigma factor [Eubacterium sp.]